MTQNFENAIIAFSEWLKENDASYAIFVVKNDRTRFMLDGDTADVISAIATAMIDVEQVRDLIYASTELAESVLNEDKSQYN